MPYLRNDLAYPPTRWQWQWVQCPSCGVWMKIEHSEVDYEFWKTCYCDSCWWYWDDYNYACYHWYHYYLRELKRCG